MPADRSKSVVLLAWVASVCSAVAMLWAAASTGSAALFASGVLFLAAGCSQTLMLLGLASSAKRASASATISADPYVWSFVAALILFSLGAGVAVYEGIGKMTDAPRILLRSQHAYTALAIAFGLTVAALARVLAAANGPTTRATLTAPALATTRIETIAALAGLVMAAIGVSLSYAWDSRFADGAAAILVGLVTGAVAALMGIEIRRLLMSDAHSLESTISADAVSADTVRDDTETARDEAEQPVPERASDAEKPAALEKPTLPARTPSEKAPPRLSRRAQKRLEQQQRRHPQQRSDT
ncbi:MAG TPA: cation transporter [Hyphomicrobium sp.]|nr:cation transporter [Hyphomicrobium sp.]